MAGLRVVKGNHGPQVYPEAIPEVDLVVIQRDFPRFWRDYKKVVKLAREYGKPVIYDLDDLLVEIPEKHSHKADYSGEMLTMLYAILDADMITASSPFLQAYLAELNPNTKLVHNYLNDRLWGLGRKKEPQGDGSRITIGYMGGQTHQQDLEYIKDVLLNVFKKYPEIVRYKFWGTHPPRELLDLPFSDFDPINQEDYAQFANYFSLQECDVFIAPLVDNEFNRAKSSIKFLEYSIHGSPGVYSDLPPYETIIEHGINGFLADNLNDWESHLVTLIENPALREQIGAAAQQTVKDGWLLSSNAHQLKEAYLLALDERGEYYLVEDNFRNLKSILSRAEKYQSNLEDSLYAAENQLTEIHNSRSWNMLKKIQRIRLKIFPKR